MAIFIIRETGQQDRRYQIREKEIRVGRGNDCHLTLPHTTVSRMHFKLERIDKETATLTNVSSQPLLVNGTPIKAPTNLKNQDVLQVGKFSLVFFGDNLTPLDQFFEGKGLDEFPPYTRSTNATKTDDTFSMSPAEAKKLLNSNNLARNAKLNTADGSQHWVPGKKGLQIGKNQTVPISGWLVSGVVAEIKWVGSAHQLESKGGWTKVSVNGSKLEHPRRLSEGDHIKIGSQEFTYTEK